MADQVYAYLREKTTFDLPADVVADQAMSILQRQYVNLLMRGTPKEEVEEQMEQLKASSDQQAKDQLKLFFIMSKIAGLFKIEVTEEEINGHIAAIAAQRGRRPEKMREELARDGSLAQFTLQVQEQKCIEKILEKASIAEVELLGGISLLSPEYLLSFEQRPFHSGPPDHYVLPIVTEKQIGRAHV